MNEISTVAAENLSGFSRRSSPDVYVKYEPIVDKLK
jgi:hypothetical protein